MYDDNYQRMPNNPPPPQYNQNQFNNNAMNPPRVPADDAEDDKKFKWFPTQQNVVPGEEAERLRYHLWLMLMLHITFLILFEIWLYHFRWYLFIMEFVYAYLCYQSIMTLETKFIYAYITLMYLSLLGFTQITEVGNFIICILFVL